MNPPARPPLLGTLLLVEDDRAARDPIEASLSSLGYQVLVAENGSAALQALQSEQLCLVILDLGLPGGVDGYGVLDRIHQDPELCDLPVIVTTGAPYDSRLAGSVGYLRKPHTLDRLLDLVERWCPEPMHRHRG